MIRKSVYNMKTRIKLSIQTVKDWKDFVQMIVSIHCETFDLQALFKDEITSGYTMRSGLLGMMFI